MKRADIEKLFEGKLAEGIEVKDIVDSILDQNGKDVNAAKDGAQKMAADDIEKTKVEAINKAVEDALKPYKEGGELFINRDEFKRISDENKAYKERDTKTARETAIGELLKTANFDAKATRLLQKAVGDYEPKFGENNKIENGDEIIEKMKVDYSDFIVTNKEGGFTPAKPQEPVKEIDSFTSGFMKEISNNKE